MLDRIFALYGEGGHLLEATSAPEDAFFRQTYLVRYRDRRRVFLRTLPYSQKAEDSVKQQATLITHYRTLGADCPRILKSLRGNDCERMDTVLVYAVERKKYLSIADYASDERQRARMYRVSEPAVFSLIGRAASHSAPLIPQRTPYCLYEPFIDDEKTDENFECASTLLHDIFGTFPMHAKRADELFSRYCADREAFRPIYAALPRAVFQGNLEKETILVTPGGRFRGLEDFSLLGSETILNYAFCESFEPPVSRDVPDLLNNRWSMHERDQLTMQRLSWIGEEYTFSEAECIAFLPYYHITVPFRWPCFSVFQRVLRGAYASSAAPKILDWIEYQMTRTDVSSWLSRANSHSLHCF